MPDNREKVLSQPGERRRRRPRFQMSNEGFGVFAENVASFMGTPQFLVYMTAFVTLWIVFNMVGIFGFRWDPYPFILLNLFFSTQASYAAPLILLAQNRQDMRDKLSLEQDRMVAQQARDDMDFLAREIASIRMSINELAGRDFVRSELRDLTERLETALHTAEESRAQQ